MKKTIVIVWSSPLAGAVAEALFFTLIDPPERYFLGPGGRVRR